MAASVQGRCAQILDLTVGSVMRSLLEAWAASALWLQWLIVLLMQRQRLSTAAGTDVDSFCADFNFTRLAATTSVGTVTLSRFYNGTAATILVGTLVMTGDGSTQFQITADPTNSLWSPSLTNSAGVVVGGFVIPSGTSSANFAAQAVVASAAGNVQAGAISLLGQAIAGIDTVTNAAAFAGGTNPESDAAMKTRFALYISNLSQGTLGAVDSAIAAVGSNVYYNVAINTNVLGGYQPGNMAITIDNGTGYPPASMLTAVSNAVEAVRAVTETFTVNAPAITTVNVVMTVTVGTGITHNAAIPIIATALTTYINALPVGSPLTMASIPYQVFTSLPAGQVANVTNITLNGGTSDIVVPFNGVAKAGTITVN